MIRVEAFSKTNSLVCSFECEEMSAETHNYSNCEYTTLWFFGKDRKVVGRAYIDTFHHPNPLEGYAHTLSRMIDIRQEGDDAYNKNVKSIRITKGKNMWSY